MGDNEGIASTPPNAGDGERSDSAQTNPAQVNPAQSEEAVSQPPVFQPQGTPQQVYGQPGTQPTAPLPPQPGGYAQQAGNYQPTAPLPPAYQRTQPLPQQIGQMPQPGQPTAPYPQPTNHAAPYPQPNQFSGQPGQHPAQPGQQPGQPGQLGQLGRPGVAAGPSVGATLLAALKAQFVVLARVVSGRPLEALHEAFATPHFWWVNAILLGLLQGLLGPFITAASIRAVKSQFGGGTYNMSLSFGANVEIFLLVVVVSAIGYFGLAGVITLALRVRGAQTPYGDALRIVAAVSSPYIAYYILADLVYAFTSSAGLAVVMAVVLGVIALPLFFFQVFTAYVGMNRAARLTRSPMLPMVLGWSGVIILQVILQVRVAMGCWNAVGINTVSSLL
ncbi:Yip1 family protein [Neoactinobaculum massilliense]|uniref:Yip1 family protein n=1 Tax=Neoactinobaculum massilliense TaxID=2364794 RepID=UPI000F537672|nr:Yip1 family protein [Neoactinobaculum massilliense]